MIAIPAISNGPESTGRDAARLFVWRNHMLGLTLAVGVEDSKVDCPARGTIRFGNHLHPRLPGGGDAGWHRLNDAQSDILVQLRLDFITPVDWNGSSSKNWLGSQNSLPPPLDGAQVDNAGPRIAVIFL